MFNLSFPSNNPGLPRLQHLYCFRFIAEYRLRASQSDRNLFRRQPAKVPSTKMQTFAHADTSRAAAGGEIATQFLTRSTCCDIAVRTATLLPYVQNTCRIRLRTLILLRRKLSPAFAFSGPFQPGGLLLSSPSIKRHSLGDISVMYSLLDGALKSSNCVSYSINCFAQPLFPMWARTTAQANLQRNNARHNRDECQELAKRADEIRKSVCSRVRPSPFADSDRLVTELLCKPRWLRCVSFSDASKPACNPHT